MNTTEILVLVSGGVLIAGILWFFFGPKEAKTANTIAHGVQAGRPAPVKAASSERADLAISGMTCAACVSRVEKAAKRVPGVTEATVNLLANQGAFTYDPLTASPQLIQKAIEKIGYNASPLSEAAPGSHDHDAEGKALSRRFWTAALLTIPVVIGAMGMDLHLPVPVWLANPWLANPWLALVLTTPVLFWAGGKFFRGAFLSLKQRSSDMNTLIALGTGTAYLYSLAVTVSPHVIGIESHVYYETAGVIITLPLLGRTLEARAKGKTGEAGREGCHRRADCGTGASGTKFAGADPEACRHHHGLFRADGSFGSSFDVCALVLARP